MAKYVFFWRHTGEAPETCFSQWDPTSFVDHGDTSVEQVGVKFATAEHYMMYHKALLMNDPEGAQKILKAPNPRAAQALGRGVKNFDQALWNEQCERIVEEGNWLKFSQNKECREVLLATGSRDIVEASPFDAIWGIGFTAENAKGQEKEWGTNKLGKALMRVRERLRADLKTE